MQGSMKMAITQTHHLCTRIGTSVCTSGAVAFLGTVCVGTFLYVRSNIGALAFRAHRPKASQQDSSVDGQSTD